MKKLRLIVIGWMLLWLTGNGALAALMPFCEHAAGQNRQAAVAAHHDHGQAHAPDAAEHAQHSTFLDNLCDNCDLCHLASSALPSDNAPRGGPPARGAYLSDALAHPASHFPDPPQHVPLARLV